jgi:hypothetical protein
MKALLAMLLVVGLGVPVVQAQDSGFKKSDFTSVTVDVSRIKATRIGGGDYDDKTEKLTFKVKMRNGSTRITFNDLKVEFFLFGICQEDRKSLKLMQRTAQTVTLEPLKELVYDTPEVVSMWDNTDAVFGDKYKGWCMLIYTPSGELLAEKTVSAFVKNLDRLPGLVEGKYYDNNLNPTVVKPFSSRLR